ncbi:putative porin [Pedobacter sp.]|uniref:putative porin n=1 Tax=Pedobacter sp. TaxID=1411316 RepID=UPI003BA90FBF
MRKAILFCLVALFFIIKNDARAQDLKTNVGNNKELDSLRKKEEGEKDSIVYNAKYIKFTKMALSKDSIVLLPLDTSTYNIQNYSPLLQPRHPAITTGSVGQVARPLLYEPSRRIGFDVGFHALDYYALSPEDIIYYQARAPYTSLYLVSAGQKEQYFKATHSQNIKKNWNMGLNFNRMDSRGFYSRQRGDNLNIAIFSWYQSPNKRYNMWASAIFNTLRAYENGSIQADTIFNDGYSKIDRKAEATRLTTARNMYKKNTLFVKQTYYVGRIDSTTTNSSVLPTNKVTYTLEYNNDSYGFYKNEEDDNSVIPKALTKSDGLQDLSFTSDSTHIKHIKNEFVYSFFLRPKNSSVIKNELKLDAGIRHDYYQFQSLGSRSNGSTYSNREFAFQNMTVVGALGYRFTSNIDFNLDVNQVFQGRNAGDFLYEAKSNIALSKSIGRLQLSAYLQNQSPSEIFNFYDGNHFIWNNNFQNVKVANLSFAYINDKLGLEAGAKYFLTSNYLYFGTGRTISGINDIDIKPLQEKADISLIRLDVAKKWRFGKFLIENYLAYQKTDNNDVLRTPEFYTCNSFSFDLNLFKVLKTNIGFDVRYNTAYENYSYSPALAQFYVGDAIALKSVPVVDVYLKANLKRANIFVKYDYANQGLLSNGYYTVNRYPMPDALLKFGLTWNFYD